MICPECHVLMEALGYGDEKCPECGYIEYHESDEEFDNRIESEDGDE